MALVKYPILITGANGFVGANLVRRLLQNKNQDIHALVRPNSNLKNIEEILPQVHLHRADLSDFTILKGIISDIKPKGVFHLAASNIMSGVTAQDEQVVKSNFLGTVNLIKAMESFEYDFFINTGSFLELRPTEVYSISKLAATLYAQAFAELRRKPILTFRLFTPYGPFLQSGRLIHEIILKAMRNEDVVLTDPRVTRDFIFVGDIADLYLEAAGNAKKNAGKIFNLGSGKGVPIERVVNYILRAQNSKSRPIWGGFHAVNYDSDFWQADMQQTFNSFKWRPKTSLENGLDATINWFKSFKINETEKT